MNQQVEEKGKLAKALRRLPLKSGEWGRPALLFALSRLYMGALMAFFARFFTIDFSGRFNLAKPDYWTVTTASDGDWYRTIAEYGYPRNLTIYADGAVEKSEWAFYPLWPMLCRLVSEVTQLPFYAVAHILVLILGCAASIVTYRLMLSLGVSEKYSLWSLAFLLFSPTGVIFSLAYTEALTLLLLASTLLLICTKKYLWSCAPIFLLGLTRPIALAVTFALLLYFISRWRQREATPFAMNERWAIALTSAFSALSFLMWPALIAFKFGRWDAYFYLQSAWRDYSTPSIAEWLLTSPTDNVILSCGLIAGVALALFSFCRRSSDGAVWPPLLRSWAIGYTAFLLLTIPAGTAIDSNFDLGTTIFPSIFRYLMLTIIPVVPFVALGGARPSLRAAGRVSFLLLSFVLTLAYVRFFIVMEPPIYYFWP